MPCKACWVKIQDWRRRSRGGRAGGETGIRQYGYETRCGDPDLFAQQRSFCAISLDGAVVQADHSGGRAMYGSDVAH
jgi:hypothetical protein